MQNAASTSIKKSLNLEIFDLRSNCVNILADSVNLSHVYAINETLKNFHADHILQNIELQNTVYDWSSFLAIFLSDGWKFTFLETHENYYNFLSLSYNYIKLYQ